MKQKKTIQELERGDRTPLVDQKPDWMTHKDPNAYAKVTDLPNALAEVRRLKKENTGLVEERRDLRVNAEKYEKRAVYVRKKFNELKEMYEKKGGKVNDISNVTGASNQTSKYRIKCTEL